MSAAALNCAPRIKLLTGRVLTPNTDIIAVGWFSKIDAEGRVVRDGDGPIKMFLATLATSTSPARSALVGECVATDIEGKWQMRIAGDVIPGNALQSAFSNAPIVYVIFEQGQVSRTPIAMTYADGKASTAPEGAR